MNAAALARLRHAAGLTRAELAARAGLTVRAVEYLEVGVRTNPHLETLVALAGALGISTPALVAELLAEPTMLQALEAAEAAGVAGR